MTAATARSVTITLPLPPLAVSPNSRAHVLTKGRAMKQYREAAYYAALAVLPPGRFGFARATLEILYVVCLANPLGIDGRARPRDEDNAQACCKAALDGALKDSGLLLDDSARYLTQIHTTLDRHSKRACPGPGRCAGSRVVLTVTEVLL